MGILFCITGKSGSGKDTVFKELKQAPDLGLVPIIPYTTRPKRFNETEGKDYHFISEEELEKYEKKGLVIEKRSYRVVQGIWYYCTIDDENIDLSSNSYILIATLSAYNSLRNYYGKDFLCPVYIDVEDGIRLKRALEREASQPSPDYREMCRRFLADCEDFSEEALKNAGIDNFFNNGGDLEKSINEIKNYIKRKLHGRT